MAAKEVMDTRIRDKEHQIGELATKYGAKNIRILGSARAESHQDSDLDVVVQMQPGRSFLDLIGLWQSLEELLGKKMNIMERRF